MGTPITALVRAVHSRLDHLDARLGADAEATGLQDAMQRISAAADDLLLVPTGPGTVHDAALRQALQRLDRGCCQLEELLGRADSGLVPARAIIAALTAASGLATAALAAPDDPPLAQTA